jgi:hypothetical protein
MKSRYKILIILFYAVISYLFYGFFSSGDDTYIYLQYAKHIIHNGEISFNLGEISYGFTSPLWLLMIVGIGLVVTKLTLVPTLLSLLFTIFTVIVWFKIIEHVETRLKYILLISAFIVLDPNLMKHAFLGMEAGASYFLSSVIIYLLFIEKTKKILLGISTGLFILIRPESVLLAVLVIIYTYFVLKYSFKDMLTIISVIVIINLPVLIWAKSYFNVWLPNTFKARGIDYPLASMFFVHVKDFILIFGSQYGIHFLLIIWSIIGRKKASIIEIFIGVIIVTFILFYALTLSNELVYSRYFCIIFPFLNFALLIALKDLSEFNNHSFQIAVVSLIVLLASSFVLASLKKSIYLEDEKVETEISDWVKRNTLPNAHIIRGRIGKIAFLTDKKIIDPVGLINTDISKYKRADKLPQFYKNMSSNYFIGNDKYLESELHKVFKLKIVKEFAHTNTFTLRDLILKRKEKQDIKIIQLTPRESIENTSSSN